jgi:hypothetical protein
MQNPPPVAALLVELTEFLSKLVLALAPAGVHWRWRPTTSDNGLEWSLVEIVCHLRDVEREVHLLRFRTMVEMENPFLAGVDADQWAESRAYFQQDGRAALADFAAARQETLTLLQQLPEVLWWREARHAFFGQTTLHELLYLAVQHDRVHWQQVQRNLREGNELAKLPIRQAVAGHP